MPSRPPAGCRRQREMTGGSRRRSRFCRNKSARNGVLRPMLRVFHHRSDLCLASRSLFNRCLFEHGAIMRSLARSSRALLFCLLSLCAFSQENSAIRVCVALPAAHADITKVADSEVRDLLVKSVNLRNIKKKSNLSVEAVALDAGPGGQAVAEATQKNCQFVLYSWIPSLRRSYKYEPSADGSFQNVAHANATVEYLVRRITDGASYAEGQGESESVVSEREAIVQAVERAGENVVDHLREGGNIPAGQRMESSTLEKLVPGNMAVKGDFCGWLPGNVAHADALHGVCEYALTLPQRMPNFVCRQETSRFEGRSQVPADLITATVRYVDGDESYSDVKRNGIPQEDVGKAAGLWSSGQFEGNLRTIFYEGNHTAFEFEGENQLGGHAVWVFKYQIAQQNEPLWQLRSGDNVIAPAYHGELWVDEQTGAVARFRAAAKSLPQSFPMQSAEVETDYGRVEFGDGTDFVLPSASTIATKFRGVEPTRNVVQFQGCHKFRAKATMVMEAAASGESRTAEQTNSAELSKAEQESDNTIYAILREQAIREDEQRTAAEQQAQTNALTQAAFQRLAALEKMRQQRVQAAAANSAPPSPGGESLPILRVNVRLVPVSVVVRDAKGNTVGDKSKEDFLLFDDRKPQVITQFWVDHSEEPNEPEKEAGKVTSETAPAAESRAPVRVENNVAYVFDDLHIGQEDLKNASDAAAKHLAELGENDRAALFTTSGEIEVEFTSDREKLLAALRRLKVHPPQGWNCPPISYYAADLIVNHADGAASDMATADAKECVRYAPSGGPTAGAAEAAMAQRLAASRAMEVALAGRVDSERALGMLDQIIAKTAAMPGRKTIVLVSPGILTVAPGAQGRAMALIDRAVQSNIVVNTLDVTGLSTAVDTGGHFADMPARGQLATQETLARNEMMADLAYGTGGTFFHNNNDLNEGFRRTADTPEFIYVLGFSPQKLDGKFHKLKVDLKDREKLTVQARSGYYAVKRAATQ